MENEFFLLCNHKQLKELKEQGYSLLSIDSTGQTALHHSCYYGHEEIVRFLITCAPGLINMIDNDKGQTALHKAVSRGRRSICHRLVAGGAILTIQDNDGKTAKMLAIEIDDNELSVYLESKYRENGCDLCDKYLIGLNTNPFLFLFPFLSPRLPLLLYFHHVTIITTTSTPFAAQEQFHLIDYQVNV